MPKVFRNLVSRDHSKDQKRQEKKDLDYGK